MWLANYDFNCISRIHDRAMSPPILSANCCGLYITAPYLHHYAE